MLSVLMKLPLLSLTAMEDADLNKTIGGDDVSISEELRSIGCFKTSIRYPPLHHNTSTNVHKNILATIAMRSSSLHFHLGVVDEILQRVGAGVVIAELSVICDYSCGRIVGAHHTADVHRLDVGEVSKDPCAGCAGGLKVTQQSG